MPLLLPLFALLLGPVLLLGAGVPAHAIEFRDYYETDEIAAYKSALKRKDFRAQIHWKPLIVAAADNADLNTVRWMLENDVRADVADPTGRTGLFHLASRNPAKIPPAYAEIARLLLVNGADPNRFASGTSVIRTLVSGNRDVVTLKVLLAYGADPNGNRQDLYPPVCGAATPEFIDTLVAAGARLQFDDRTDVRNAADCVALDDLDRKERKRVLQHLAEVYGIVPTGEKPVTPMAPVPPALLPPGHYLYSEQTHARPAWGERPVITVDYVTIATGVPMSRAEMIATLARPEGFRREKWVTSTPALERCQDDCSAEIAGWQAFAQRNRLVRTFARQEATRTIKSARDDSETARLPVATPTPAPIREPTPTANPEAAGVPAGNTPEATVESTPPA